MKLISLFSACVLIALSNSALAQTTNHYEILRDKYTNYTNGAITAQAMEGAYLGRCFLQGNDTPVGMVMATRKNVVTTISNADEGPDFPQVSTTTTTWQMIFGLIGGIDTNGLPNSAASDSDNTTAADWNALLDQYNPVLTVSNGVAKSEAGDAFYEVKLGNDNLFYGRVPVSKGIPKEYYCYFYKKLN